MNGINPYENNCFLHSELCGDNPAINTIKRLGQNGIFLAAIITYGINMLLSFFQSMQPLSGEAANAFNISFIFVIPQAIIFAGLLTFYISCRTYKYTGVKPAGLQIIFYTEFVVAIILALIAVLTFIGYMSAASDGDIRELAADYINESDMRQIEAYLTNKTFIAIVGVIFALIIAVCALFYIYALKSLKRIIKTVRAGVYCGKLSVILAVVLILIIVYNIFSIFVMEFSIYAFLINITNIIMYILFTIGLFKYNGEMEGLWYATIGSPLI
ncbi:MAG: hypothetical protein PHW77_04660 [Eubacteriales bacterium]|nr:hypothetical protein [Eubacteriales bacterium]